jgi:TrmH family RNA methyltransferase
MLYNTLEWAVCVRKIFLDMEQLIRKYKGMNKHFDRITVILYRPIHPGNIGSVARAMKNMGLHRLRLVSPCDFRTDLAQWMAVSAKEILDRAEVFEELTDALKGSNRVIGTIPPNRPRFQPQTFSPKELARRFLKTHPDDQISILFGPEDNGLSNRELDLCDEFVSIPSHPAFHSLNLAQSVMVVAYEIFSCSLEQQAGFHLSKPLAEVTSLEQMYQHLQETLLTIGFLDRGNPGHIMRDLRRIFGRAQLDERDVKILRGIFRQMDWAARQNPGKKE